MFVTFATKILFPDLPIPPAGAPPPPVFVEFCVKVGVQVALAVIFERVAGLAVALLKVPPPVQLQDANV